ncbi:MAG: GNAT family N-acetyltransferase [Rubrobacteraceae bacterium]
MKRETLRGRRVRDGEEVEFVELAPETPEDEEGMELLDRLGVISRGDTFAEQREHDRLVEKRREEIRHQARNPDSSKIGFERMRRAHIPLAHHWLHTPHVARWWYDDVGPYEEVEKRYAAYIEGKEPVEPFLILHGELPIGYIQTYRVSDDEECNRLIGIEDSAGVDLFIGEEEFLYRGLGALIIRRFLEEVVFADESIEVCVIDPEPENRAAIRAYEKAGFRYFKTIHVPGESAPAHLMKLPRKEFFGE